MIYPFSGLLHPTLEFCGSERKLNNTRQHLHVSRVYTHLLRPVYTHSASVLCRYTLACKARICRRFEFARHFESRLARPPPFICACERRLPMNIPYMLRSTRMGTYSFKEDSHTHDLVPNLNASMSAAHSKVIKYY